MPKPELLTNEQLAALETLGQQATPGEWQASLDLPLVANNNPDKRLLWRDSMMVADFRSIWIKQEEAEANAALTAAAHNALSALLAEVRAARQQHPEPSTMCGCGHARHLHEYGAFGYNANAECRSCDCPCFAEPLPPAPPEPSR